MSRFSDHLVIESYGLTGSEWLRCLECGGESGAGVLFDGVPHEPNCKFRKTPDTIDASGEEDVKQDDREEIIYDMLSQLSGLDTHDANVRDQSSAYEIVEAAFARLQPIAPPHYVEAAEVRRDTRGGMAYIVPLLLPQVLHHGMKLYARPEKP